MNKNISNARLNKILDFLAFSDIKPKQNYILNISENDLMFIFKNEGDIPPLAARVLYNSSDEISFNTDKNLVDMMIIPNQDVYKSKKLIELADKTLNTYNFDAQSDIFTLFTNSNEDIDNLLLKEEKKSEISTKRFDEIKKLIEGKVRDIAGDVKLGAEIDIKHKIEFDDNDFMVIAPVKFIGKEGQKEICITVRSIFNSKSTIPNEGFFQMKLESETSCLLLSSTNLLNIIKSVKSEKGLDLSSFFILDIVNSVIKDLKDVSYTKVKKELLSRLKPVYLNNTQQNEVIIKEKTSKNK